MFELPSLRYLLAAEVLVVAAVLVAWLRVWSSPSAERVQVAALATVVLLGYRAVALSLGIIATTQ